jgi:hypothetical protein
MGQNPLDWKVSYIIEKLLERRCLKGAHMTHLDTSNTSYGQKKRWESNWLPTIKSQKSPDFFAWRWRATYRWKDFDKDYNFSLDLISIRGLHEKLWAPKVTEVLVVGILGLPLRSPGTKWHLGADPMARHIVYSKGEGGGFPQVRAVVGLVSRCLLVVRPCTKVFQLRTNQLVVWFM